MRRWEVYAVERATHFAIMTFCLSNNENICNDQFDASLLLLLFVNSPGTGSRDSGGCKQALEL